MRYVPDPPTHTEVEEMARRRVWARVQIGIAAERRRRIRRAWCALLGGAGITAAAMVTVMLLVL
jgi:hypothetical protein